MILIPFYLEIDKTYVSLCFFELNYKSLIAIKFHYIPVMQLKWQDKRGKDNYKSIDIEVFGKIFSWSN